MSIKSGGATHELDRILSHLHEAFLALDREWRVIYVNAAAAAMLSRQPSEILHRPLWSLLPDLENTPLQRELTACIRDNQPRSFDYLFSDDDHGHTIHVYPGEEGLLLFAADPASRKRPDEGSVRSNEELETLVRQHTRELEQTNFSLIEEIRNHLHTVQELRLLESITRDVSSANDIHASLIAILSSVCQETGWSLGQSWLPDVGGAGLAWCPPSYWRESGLEDFRLTSQRICFIRDGDLPGRVWASGETQRIRDIAADPHFIRKEAAIQAGLGAAVAFPVVAGSEVVAVVEFFMGEAGLDDDRYITHLSSIMRRIGVLVQRRRSEDALRDSEERFRLLVDGARDYAIYMLNPEGFIMSWNAGAERLKGYSGAEIIGSHFSLFYSDEDVALDRPRHELKVALLSGRFEAEGWHIRKDGSRFWANTIIRPLRDGHGRLMGFAKITRDLSERKEAHERLQAYAGQLHQLSRRLMEAQERERRHLASELHDEIGQVLTVIKIGLQRMQDSGEREDVSALFTDNIAAIDHALARVRNMSLDLRPSMLDDFGLIAALRWYGERHSRATGIKVNLIMPEEIDRLPPELETICFRVAQEALTNVFRHARADHVELMLLMDEASLVLRVSDNGIGFDVSRLEKPDAHKRSFGLFSMRERVALIGGWLKIDSGPQRGTTLQASFPRASSPSQETL